MLVAWLSKLVPVHEAVTRTEREAVYELRYRVHVEELNRPYPDADHERKWLYSDEDDKPSTTILYTGAPRAMTGTLTIRTWARGQVPVKAAKVYSMARFPGIERLTTAEFGRLIVRPDARGKLIVPALLRVGYERLVEEKNVDPAFCYTAPGLVRYYQKFGAVPYGGSLIDNQAGPVQIPLVFVVSDVAHLERSGSFLAPLAKKYFGKRKRTPLDTTPFRHVLEPEQIPVESDPAKVWEAVQASLEEESSRGFVDVPSRVMKRLTESGFVLNLREGELVLREGTKEREVYIILEGAFEVFQDTRRIALRTKGDVIGEIAFFTQSGHRTASVRALTNGRLLVLRRKCLQELTHRDPEAGDQILMNLSRIMAERLSARMQAR